MAVQIGLDALVRLVREGEHCENQHASFHTIHHNLYASLVFALGHVLFFDIF